MDPQSLNTSSMGELPQEEKDNSLFLNIVAGLGIVLFAVSSLYMLFGQKTIKKSQYPTTTTTETIQTASEPVITITTQYTNPFDQSTQYTNPFDKQNPFDNLTQ